MYVCMYVCIHVVYVVCKRRSLLEAASREAQGLRRSPARASEALPGARRCDLCSSAAKEREP